MKILAIAEAANPDWVSVPLVGWSLSRALADVVDMHLVTQVRNTKAIEKTGWRNGEQFTAIDSEKVAAKLCKVSSLLGGRGGKGWTINTAFSSLSYYYFERLVWKQFGSRIQAGEFDIVHRITPLSPTAPSIIAKRVTKAGVPFVWGPINGGLPWPKQFDSARRAEFEWLSYVRSAYKLLPGYRSTRKHAAALIIGSKATWDQMPSKYRNKYVYVPENAIDLNRFSKVRSRVTKRPIRCVFLGRMVPYKGPDMLLEAAEPLLRQGEITLEFIGDGPLKEELQQKTDQANLPGVTFSGWVEHAQVQDHLIEADLLTFPSIREFGGGVVLEAMALGVVPVIVDYGGPGELVTDETGFCIPLGSRQEIIDRLRQSLESIIRQPEKIDEMSKAARAYVSEQFTWEAKAKQILAVYQNVLSDRK